MPESPLERLESLRHTAARRAADLRDQYDHAEAWRKLVESVAETSRDRPAATVATLNRAQPIIQARETESAEDVALLREVWQEAQDRTHAAARESVRTFAPQAEAAGLKIDAASRHPRYSFDDHLIDVELDEREAIAKIEIRHGDRIREPLDIAAVVQKLASEHSRLFDRDWKPEAFLKQVRTGYKKLKGGPDGVVLRDLAQAIAGKGKKPRLDEFAVDMGRLLSERDVEPSVRISTNHTRDTHRGLLLHGLEHGGYVLSITIEEVA